MSKLQVKCGDTGSKFIAGCSVIAYREEVTRVMRAVDSSGIRAILVDFDTCPNLDREMRRFRKKKSNGQVVDTGNRRTNTHAVECLEYTATYLNDLSEPYIRPKGRRRKLTPGQQRVRDYKKRKKQRQEAANPFGVSSTIILGPQGTYSG